MSATSAWVLVRLDRIASLSRRRALLILACVVVSLELWAAVAHLGHIARAGYLALVAPQYPVQEADLDPLAFYAPTEALVRARGLIPPDATYAVVVSTKLTAAEREAPLAFKLMLLPRVYTKDVNRAQWVIAYDVSSEGLGVPHSEEIGLSAGINLVKVTRRGPGP